MTNGVTAFQRVIDEIIRAEQLENTFAYVDNITVCGMSKEDHDQNLKRFLSVAEQYGLTLNMDKCTFGPESVNLLGYTISDARFDQTPSDSSLSSACLSPRMLRPSRGL